jgi:hypothetical protein
VIDETVSKHVTVEFLIMLVMKSSIEYQNRFCSINKEGTKTKMHRVRIGLIACTMK